VAVLVFAPGGSTPQDRLAAVTRGDMAMFGGDGRCASIK
jgi:hypothetical protein